MAGDDKQDEPPEGSGDVPISQLEEMDIQDPDAAYDQLSKLSMQFAALFEL